MGGNGFTSFPIWDDYQTTLVGDMHIPEKFHPEKGWHENVPNISPANLYEAQLNRRVTLPADPLFQPNTFIGDRVNWWERDPSRWKVHDDNGNHEYQLFFDELPSLTGQRLGEYTVLDSVFAGNVSISVDAKSMENLMINDSADLAILINYQDDNNYYFLRICETVSASGVYQSQNGQTNLISQVNIGLTDNNYHSYTLDKLGDSLHVYFDCAKSVSLYSPNMPNGKVGMGSFNDAVAFDNIRIDDIPLPTFYSFNDTICSNQNYNFYGQLINSTGVYQDTVVNYVGCDSVITLNLTVNTAPVASIVQSNDTLFSVNNHNSYQWILNGNPISGATTSFLKATTNGNYQLIVTDQNGCSDTSTVLNVIVISLEENDLNDGFSVYPNPANEYIIVNGDQVTIEEIKLFDMLGRDLLNLGEVKRTKQDNQLIFDIKYLPPGSYIINSPKTSKKIIKL